MSRIPNLLAAVAVAAALAACGGGTEGLAPIGDDRTTAPDGTAAPDSPVSTPVSPGPDQTPGEGEPEMVEPQPGMDDVRPVPWDEVEVENDTTVVVEWWSGVRPCYVLDRVEVAYGSETITVTLHQGHVPWDDEPVACIEIAKRKAVVVELDEPVDGREIVDGAPA